MSKFSSQKIIFLLFYSRLHFGLYDFSVTLCVRNTSHQLIRVEIHLFCTSYTTKWKKEGEETPPKKVHHPLALSSIFGLIILHLFERNWPQILGHLHLSSRICSLVGFSLRRTTSTLLFRSPQLSDFDLWQSTRVFN